MRELQTGLWHWEAPHPQWEPRQPWHQLVSSYAIDDGKRLLLFDPIAPPSEIEELAASRESVVVLTAPWHERDTQSIVERLGALVFTPPPDTADDLVRKYGVTAEQAVGGSPDLRWLLAEAGGEAINTRRATTCRSGSRLSRGASTTTLSSGLRAAAQSSQATPSPTSAAAWRCHASGCGRA